MGTLAPRDWFYCEVIRDDSPEDPIIAWACSTDCAMKFWKPGPGKLDLTQDPALMRPYVLREIDHDKNCILVQVGGADECDCTPNRDDTPAGKIRNLQLKLGQYTEQLAAAKLEIEELKAQALANEQTLRSRLTSVATRQREYTTSMCCRVANHMLSEEQLHSMSTTALAAPLVDLTPPDEQLPKDEPNHVQTEVARLQRRLNVVLRHNAELLEQLQS